MSKKLKCTNCFKPVARRLGLFQANDEYECYAESYVKCFWGMCDQHESIENFATKPDRKVVIKQPKRNELLKTHLLFS